MFGKFELLGILFKLFRRQTSEALPAAVTDEEGAEDDVHQLLVLTVHRTVRSHPVEFAFFITDDTDLFRKVIECLDVFAITFLNVFESCK